MKNFTKAIVSLVANLFALFCSIVLLATAGMAITGLVMLQPQINELIGPHAKLCSWVFGGVSVSIVLYVCYKLLNPKQPIVVEQSSKKEKMDKKIFNTEEHLVLEGMVNDATKQQVEEKMRQIKVKIVDNPVDQTNRSEETQQTKQPRQPKPKTVENPEAKTPQNNNFDARAITHASGNAPVERGYVQTIIKEHGPFGNAADDGTEIIPLDEIIDSDSENLEPTQHLTIEGLDIDLENVSTPTPELEDVFKELDDEAEDPLLEKNGDEGRVYCEEKNEFVPFGDKS